MWHKDQQCGEGWDGSSPPGPGGGRWSGSICLKSLLLLRKHIVVAIFLFAKNGPSQFIHCFGHYALSDGVSSTRMHILSFHYVVLTNQHCLLWNIHDFLLFTTLKQLKINVLAFFPFLHMTWPIIDQRSNMLHFTGSDSWFSAKNSQHLFLVAFIHSFIHDGRKVLHSQVTHSKWFPFTGTLNGSQ